MSNVLVLAFLLAAASPAPDAKPDPWAPVRFMTGTWRGESQGEPGQGTVEREYRFVLGDRFLHERNVSTYRPSRRTRRARSTSTGRSSATTAPAAPCSCASSTRKAS
jgi:hypothetical protein